MNYYRDIITQKSWTVLTTLVKTYRFVLIGGWAVWLYSRRLKSKDIDLIVPLEELSQFKDRSPVTKNVRLRKYEAIVDTVSVDIYVPFWSVLGLSAEIVSQSPVLREGFRLPPPEVLLITKVAAYQARKATVKGYKDLIDIVSLLLLPEYDWRAYHFWSGQVKNDIRPVLKRLLQTQVEIPELSLNRHKFAKYKKIWLSNVSF